MLAHFEKLLGLFPYSRLSERGPELRLYAIELAEPPQFEREFPPGTPPKPIIEAAAEFMHDDCACEIDTAWDLWEYQEEDWELAPSPVTLECYGAQFDNEIGDHLRIDFGPDARFLPELEIEGSLRMSQSNLRSLVHLVHDVERFLDLERRKLWSEGGTDPAAAILQALASRLN
jgi:hypothetical protein